MLKVFKSVTNYEYINYYNKFNINQHWVGFTILVYSTLSGLYDYDINNDEDCTHTCDYPLKVLDD